MVGLYTMKNQKVFFQYLFVLIFVLAISSVLGDHVSNTKIKCVESERQALLKFKESVEYGDCFMVEECGKLSSWNISQEEDCCQWRGIKCSNLTGHITALDLYYQKITGKVSLLLELKHLNYLDLGSNTFSHIPKFIGSLSELRYLNLDNCCSPSLVPPQLGNLTKLKSLSLGYQQTVENLEWLPRLVSLKYLYSNINLENTSWVQPISKLSSLKELHLRVSNLPGKTSLSLPLTNTSSMPPLSIIDLSFNSFDSSSSFEWLVNLTSSGSLIELDLSYNQFLGKVPEAIGYLSSLKRLSLSQCSLQGEFPNFFGNLRQLRYLDLRDNEIKGSVPNFTVFPHLSELYLSNNNLNGTFPESFGQISNLVHLDLNENEISGPLPDLAFLPSLIELRLGGNKLNGTIPESLGQLPKLEIFEAYSNSFEGTISEAHFSNLSKLKALVLSWNPLSFQVNTNWTPPFQLEAIKLASCNLGPQFPKWLQSQKSFSVLDISNAQISDTIPSWFWDLPIELEYLNVSYNQINGPIGNLTSKFRYDFSCLDLTSNHFYGPIPVLPEQIEIILLSKNMLTGSVPYSLCNNFIFAFDASDNQLSGNLPDCFMSISFINLANNNLSGRIPGSIDNLIEGLELRNNSLTGEFPLSLRKCNRLLIIDLSLNKLTGKVPAWIGMDLQYLEVLSLRGNKFYGEIPPEICQLSQLQILDLSQNNILGNIPLCFSNFSSMVQAIIHPQPLGMVIGEFNSDFIGFVDVFADALVEWKRRESKYTKSLVLLRSIDLSSNKLVGNIPPELASLAQLISLNLSRNNLSGNIIQNIGEMKMLESIDLSNNHLSGKIPISLSNLNFLGVIDFSNNNLSGKIPQSTQLQTQDASAYARNPELCGPPLEKICPEDEVAPAVPPSNDNPEDEDRFIKMGFYVSVALGFIVGFWCFCGPLVLKKSRRYAYFKKLQKIFDWVYVTWKVKKTKQVFRGVKKEDSYLSVIF